MPGRGVAALAVALVASTAFTAPARAEAVAPAGEYLGAVTLLTGDRVSVRRVGERLIPAVDPAVGREHVAFSTAQSGRRLDVVPADAWAEVAAGRLDARLFDVAGLLRAGYGDAERGDLPLLAGVRPSAARQDKGSAAADWRRRKANRSAEPLWLDGIRKPLLDNSVRQIGALQAWQTGYTGAGVTVAVLDTGVDLAHPDLRDRVVGTRDFVGGGVVDTDGHGTHVASTVAGSGKASGGRHVGVAPGAELVVGKVCGDRGCPESAILAGMRWAVEQGAEVVNLSLGGPDTAAVDPLEAAVAELGDRALFVVAAGNDGSDGAETVASPASADKALAVGAVDGSDALASFSARGPRTGDAALKPEIVAPGVGITAARSKDSTGSGRYTDLSGTSMASPHVAGAAAILAQQHPDWTAQRLKAALVGSAEPVDGTPFEQGAGRVDIARGVTQTVLAEPAVVSAGRQRWPHDDDPVLTRTLTYTNTAPAPQTLTLALTDAPAGMFSLSAETITLPANGSGSVTLTVDTRVTADETTHGTRVEATSGTRRVTTPVAVDREPESYDLTLRPVDRDGAPTDAAVAFILGTDRYRPVPTVGGAGTVRVRRGSYHVDAAISTPRADGATADSHKVVHPAVEVTADTTVVLDAADARPVDVTFDRPGVRPRAVGAGYTRTLGDRAVFTGVLGDDLDRIFLGQVGAPDDSIVADVGGAFTAGEVSYNLAWFTYGTLPAGFTRHVVDSDLARVDTTYRAQRAGRTGSKLWVATEPRAQASSGYGLPVALPATRTEFHNADDLTWYGEFHQLKDKTTELTLTGSPTAQPAGTTSTEAWNSAVSGPTVTGGDWATRTADSLSFSVPLYGDPGHRGTSTVDYGSTTLFRDGTRLAVTETPGTATFDVSPDPTRYRVEVVSVRSGVSSFSTLVTTAWTFTTARPADRGKGGTPLPVAAVGFAPRGLGPDNRVTGGRTVVPVTVSWPDGLDAPAVTTLAVDASFDDGATWRAVRVEDGAAVVEHPGGTRFVSLRAKVGAADGSSAEQVVLRAYGAK